MINAKFGKRTYVRIVEEEDESGEDRLGRNRGELIRNDNDNLQRQRMTMQAKRQGTELQREAARKKHYFQQKMALEGKRKKFGTGNIVTFLMAESRQGIEHSE